MGGSVWKKASRFAAVATSGQALAKELVQTRCERGEKIARQLQLPELTARAIHCLDEHWDGSGYPSGRAGEEIPVLARIMGLAQTLEVFWQRAGIDAACSVAAHRRGTWFDPRMVDAFLSVRNDPKFLASMRSEDVATEAAALEPAGMGLPADDEVLERLAVGFGEVVDAKSPWTFEHSRGVAVVAEGIGKLLDISGRRLRTLRWAALLHDIGKLGVSNLILDKPGQLNAEEMTKMRRHPAFTYEILRRVRGFSEFADMAAGHHEKLDGRGYHLGLSGDTVTLEMRILGVADMYEALAAKRPYRPERTSEEALTIIDREAGKGLCPMVVSALKAFLKQSHFVPYQVAA